MTAYLLAAIACRILAVLAVGGTVWLAHLGHPWLAALAGWVAFLAVVLGGRCHAGHRRTPARPVTRNRPTAARTVRTRP